MQITPIGLYPNKIYFQSEKVKKDRNKRAFFQKSTYTKEELNNYLGIATGVGIALAGAFSSLLSRATIKELSKSKKMVKNLTENNKTLSKMNDSLKKEIKEAKESLSELLEGDIAPKEQREHLFKTIKEKIENSDYGYDIENPPTVCRKKTPVYDDAIPLPETVGTTNRMYIEKQDIPEIKPDGSFDYELPMSSIVKITHSPSTNFKPVENQLTNISESYAQSVQWNNDKIARDILQNFFDGHGQTLDGVKFHFEPTSNNKYKVRIEGKSTFTPDKAIYIGESSKRYDAKAAGNYGEGLKMATLKLLKDGGANNVKIASDNWKVNYTLVDGNLSDKKVLAYSLEKVDKFNGNYIEFETSDKKLLDSLRKTINRFYNSGNTHFKCPDFENDLIGIKTVHGDDFGGFYIAGQRFEVNGNYDGLDNYVIFLKEKPPVKVLDISRDRTSLNSSNFRNLGYWLATEDRMSKTDKIKFLKVLEPYWHKSIDLNITNIGELLDGFIGLLNIGTENSILHIKFPEKYVAYSNATKDLVWDLRKKGYNVCRDNFSKLGMQTIEELLGDVRAHDVVIPNDVEKKKILIIKEALNKLAPALKENEFTDDEINANIYMFNRYSVKDMEMYANVAAEAIIDKAVSKGFWLDKSYLQTASFSDALEMALHELSHKVGGDESSEFSYQLTNVNQSVINQIVNNVKTRNEMQAMNNLWNSLE